MPTSSGTSLTNSGRPRIHPGTLMARWVATFHDSRIRRTILQCWIGQMSMLNILMAGIVKPSFGKETLILKVNLLKKERNEYSAQTM